MMMTTVVRRYVANGAAQDSIDGVGNQTDTDGDGAGDACDTDDDNDGVLDLGADIGDDNDDDNCRTVANGASQASIVGVGNQTDTDGDGAGDACDTDDDDDGVLDLGADIGDDNDDDNCRTVANGASQASIVGVGNQTDTDDDGDGDACDTDDDDDGVLDLGADIGDDNDDDNCRTVANGASQASTPGVGNQTDTDDDGEGDACDVDDDNNGLIEIRNLDMLHHIRHNLAGTTYDDNAAIGPGNEGVTTGAPTTSTTNCATPTDGVYLCGYELSQDLDFAKASDYANNTRNPTWCPVVTTCNSTTTTDAGFPGLGATGTNNGFSAIFDGKGNTISNLYMRNTESAGKTLGLFIKTEAGAKIRNIKIEDANLYGNSGADTLGVLVGENNGDLRDSSAIGTGGAVNGGAGADELGGLGRF